MRKIVIYPGRFHPFHKGHKSVYDHLVAKYGAHNVYVVTSNSQAPMTSPFSFEEKREMMTALGIPRSKIVQVRIPYVARELTDQFDPDKTAVIYAVSEKDEDRFSFKPKKDGSPSYFQPLTRKLKPLSQHGYVELTPTTDFKIGGKTMNSASQIRNLYVGQNDEGRSRIITDLYGKPNDKVKQIFDKKLTMLESMSVVYLHAPLFESTMAAKYRKVINDIRELEEIVREEEFFHL